MMAETVGMFFEAMSSGREYYEFNRGLAADGMAR
jgi:hypothetical protein